MIVCNRKVLMPEVCCRVLSDLREILVLSIAADVDIVVRLPEHASQVVRWLQEIW